jgi:hypothetical protein
VESVDATERGGLMFTRAYGYTEGTFLYEQGRLRSCGLPQVRTRRAAPLTLAATVKWARRIPRSAREAQGFTRILDFARHVKELRAKRAELRKQRPDPLRRAILDTLERIMSDRFDQGPLRPGQCPTLSLGHPSCGRGKKSENCRSYAPKGRPLAVVTRPKLCRSKGVQPSKIVHRHVLGTQLWMIVPYRSRLCCARFVSINRRDYGAACR